ncbi:MAG: hypothetical protein U0798_15225 [Gemmataceae bacterium]
MAKAKTKKPNKTKKAKKDSQVDPIDAVEKPVSAETTEVKSTEAKSTEVKATDYTSKDALSAYDFETQREATDRELDAERAKDDWLIKKARAADAKRNFEHAQEELNTYIRERAQRRGKPPKQDLFAEANSQAAKDERDVANAAVTNGVGSTVEEWPPTDLWKQYPIARLSEYGLTAKDIEHIESGEVKKGTGIGPLLTMGALSKFTEAIPGTNYNRGYQDLKGIGQAGVDRISNAETAFWAAWRKGVGERFAAEKGLVKPVPAETVPPAEHRATNGEGAPKGEAAPTETEVPVKESSDAGQPGTPGANPSPAQSEGTIVVPGTEIPAEGTAGVSEAPSKTTAA